MTEDEIEAIEIGEALPKTKFSVASVPTAAEIRSLPQRYQVNGLRDRLDITACFDDKEWRFSAHSTRNTPPFNVSASAGALIRQPYPSRLAVLAAIKEYVKRTLGTGSERD